MQTTTLFDIPFLVVATAFGFVMSIFAISIVARVFRRQFEKRIAAALKRHLQVTLPESTSLPPDPTVYRDSGIANPRHDK